MGDRVTRSPDASVTTTGLGANCRISSFVAKAV